MRKQRPGPEVDLGRFTRLKMEDHEGWRLRAVYLGQEPFDGARTALEVLLAPKNSVNLAWRTAGVCELLNAFSVRFHEGNSHRDHLVLYKQLLDLLGCWHRERGIEPTQRLHEAPDRRGSVAAGDLHRLDLTSALPRSQGLEQVLVI